MRVLTGTLDTPYFLSGDHLGSTSLATSNSGAVVAQVKYKAFGEIRSNTGTLPTDYKFTGQRQENMTGGLYDYGARYYDGLIGRFIAPDSAILNRTNPQSLNRFSYVSNNPLRFVDPTGNVEEGEGADADNILQQLLIDYGITVVKDYGWIWEPIQRKLVWTRGSWEFKELNAVLKGAQDLASKLGGPDSFRDKVGPTHVVRENLPSGQFPGILENAPGAAANGTIVLWDNAFYDQNGNFDEPGALRRIVHELAHVWDKVDMFANAGGGSLASGMEAYLGGSSSCRLAYCIRSQPVPPYQPSNSYAEGSRREDWAVAVSAWVYNDPLTPDRARFIELVVAPPSP